MLRILQIYMNNNLNVFLADDEPLVRETVAAYISEWPWVKITGEARNGREVVDNLKHHNVDLLLLDINMPELNGFEALSSIPSDRRPMVVFLTAYDEYALQAFETNAIDYLLKPVNAERLHAALEKALTFKKGKAEAQQLPALEKLLADIGALKHSAPATTFLKRILVKETKKYFFVNVDEVICFEASGDYVTLHKEKSKHLLNDSLTSLEERLDPQVFIRIHRSTIVNINSIVSFQPYFNGEYHITLKNGLEVKLSRNYKEKLRSVIGDQL